MVPKVSINIRTLNSGRTLEETLMSVRAQTYHNIELVISDGGSRDNTLDIAKRFKAVIRHDKKLGDARYKLFTNSKGEYVMSLDSDQVMDKNLIKACVEKCQKGSYDALIISEKSFKDTGSFLEQLISYDKYLIDKARGLSAVLDTACPRFFKKEVLLRVPWPKSLSIFDDSILHNMLIKFGAKIGYLEKSSIWHHEVGSWRIFIKKFFRYGKGYFTALSVSPKVVALHSLPRVSYFQSDAFKKPSLFFGLFLLYFIKITAASLGAFTYLVNRIVGKKV